jgi:outer membrane murein-binding lipoprotein Lpp
MKKRVAMMVLLSVFLAAGCNDPASVKRIADRNQRLSDQLADFQKMEAGRPHRVNEAFRTLDKWWLKDCKRFRERVPQVGDYFW